jgi:hypothetical protein
MLASQTEKFALPGAGQYTLALNLMAPWDGPPPIVNRTFLVTDWPTHTSPRSTVVVCGEITHPRVSRKRKPSPVAWSGAHSPFPADIEQVFVPNDWGAN